MGSCKDLDTNDDGETDLNLAYSAWVDEPLAGDWNVNGYTTVGPYRPSSRAFWLDYQNDGQMDVPLVYGNSGDLPLAGDWLENGYGRIGCTIRRHGRSGSTTNDGAADAGIGRGPNGSHAGAEVYFLRSTPPLSGAGWACSISRPDYACNSSTDAWPRRTPWPSSNRS